jgi:hypothetical protein
MSRFPGDCLTNHRPLRHRGIVLVALECAGILFDLLRDKDQRRNHTNRGDNLREIGYLFERHRLQLSVLWA